MNATLLREVAKLWGAGFRPYDGAVAPAVYETLGCDGRKEPYWMCRWPILHCMGCAKRCTPQGTAGFQAVLPVDPAPVQDDAGLAYALTPLQMVERKALLRADEAAYCLAVSVRQVYYLADMGALVKHARPPWRVTAESVLAEMERVQGD
ncbi:MAG: DNA-binding protein [Desulfovibrionaceae bacterium]